MHRLTDNEDFSEWRKSIDGRLERLAGLIPLQLDYSLESVDRLESWLLDEYPDWKSALVTEEYPTIDACGTYVGEILRRQLGGEWVIELDDEDYAYQGVPGIAGFRGSSEVPVYPRTWVTTALHRRTGMFLRVRLEKLMA